MANAIKTKHAGNVEEYIMSFPPATRKPLKQIRQIIRKIAPRAEELISYGIPAYKYHGILIYFAGFMNHVSIYPAPRQHKDFKNELAAYEGGKGTVRFALDEPIPLGLVKRIVTFRKKENEVKKDLKHAAASGKSVRTKKRA